MGLIGKLGGKKFLTAIASIIACLLTGLMGLDEATANMITNTIIGIAGTFIVVQGGSEIATGGATSSQTLPVDLEAMKRIQLALEVEKSRQKETEAQIESAKTERSEIMFKSAEVAAQAAKSLDSSVDKFNAGKVNTAPVIEDEENPIAKAINAHSRN